MTKLFLAAGVAAMAIAASATARPGDTDRTTAKAERLKDAGTNRRAQATERRAARPEVRADRTERRAGATRLAARPDRERRVEARQATRADRQRAVAVARPDRAERIADRQAVRADRQRAVAVARPDRAARIIDRQAVRADRQQVRAGRVNQVQDRLAARQELRADRAAAITLNNRNAPRVRILPAAEATRLIGSVVPAAIAAATVPTTFSMLYPDTPDYYYRYDSGYMYRVDRSSNLISALLPLLGGGYLPGQYLPANYMSSYVPSSFNAFYPNTSSQCTRYVNGVIYYVDCQTGLIENFMPLYDNGYGVGQMLPAGYGYYNVPDQYRSMYYNSADTGYWYAPGAIYQYDTNTSLITSIAALLSPGMSIGQPLPSGYGAYNVPMGFRETYYDTPDNWYRYSNGNIYQVDPVSQLVTALVVSALT